MTDGQNFRADRYLAIQTERRGPLYSIVLNKPPLNIIDIGMMKDIHAALQNAESDRDVSVVVFRGAGEKGFSAGVSIQDHTPEKITEMIPLFHSSFRLLAKTEKVTVAAIHGVCLGGGLELASLCDLVVATEDAQFGQPEIKLGQFPPVAVILLPWLIGYRKAAELILTGASIGAREAQSLGLVNRVVPAPQLSQCLDGLLGELTSQSRSTLRLTKRILSRLSGLDFDRALDESERFFLSTLAPTDDAKEGVASFLQKRPPQWRHR